MIDAELRENKETNQLYATNEIDDPILPNEVKGKIKATWHVSFNHEPEVLDGYIIDAGRKDGLVKPSDIRLNYTGWTQEEKDNFEYDLAEGNVTLSAKPLS
jgi:hypothetical protein